MHFEVPFLFCENSAMPHDVGKAIVYFYSESAPYSLRVLCSDLWAQMINEVTIKCHFIRDFTVPYADVTN